MIPAQPIAADARRVAGVMSTLAAAMAAIVSTAMPAGYFYTAYHYEAVYLDTCANHLASQLSQHIYNNSRMWAYETLRLRQILDEWQPNPPSTHFELERIYNGDIVVDMGAELRFPVLTRVAGVFDGTNRIAVLRVSRSLMPAVAQTCFVMLVSLAMAAGIFFSVRLLPLRVVGDTFRRLEAMLGALAARDAELAHHHNTLEVQVAARTDELSTANTQLGQAIADLQAAKNAADAASDARSQFLADRSHEIRTPMNGVLGMIDLLQNTDLDGCQQRYAEMIRRSGETLLGLINGILVLPKIEAGKLDLEFRPYRVAPRDR